MLYKRSSFIQWLKDVHACEISPIGERDHFAALKVKYGPAFTYIGTDPKDRIDYEEIELHCRKLYLTRWPNDTELERIE